MTEGLAKKIRFAGFEVDFHQREVRKHGMRVRLQHKPFQILELLLQQPGSLVTREEMAKHLWPDSFVNFEHSLNTAINMLRQVLGDTSQASRLIETRAGLGYCFISPVEYISAPRAPQIAKNIHHDCLKGHYFLSKMTEDDAHKAMGSFEAALLEDGCAVKANAGLADVWCEFARLSMLPARSAGEKAKECAILALGIDSQAAVAHVAMARTRMLFDWDWKRARAAFLRALELDPVFIPARRFYASLLFVIDEPAAALEQIQTAQSLEPLSLPIGVEYASLLYAIRSFQESVEQCWAVLALEPKFWPAQLTLGLAYHELGMREEALAELRNAVACSGRNPITLGVLGCLCAEQSAALLAELHQQQHQRHINPLAYALAYAGLDRLPEARDWVASAYAERDPNLLWLAHSPLLERFAGGPRFSLQWKAMPTASKP